MKTFAYILLGCFLLVSCGEDDATTSASGGTGVANISRTHFSIVVPSSWSKVPDASIQGPASGTLELAYRSNNPSKGFYNNMIIMSEPVPSGTSSFVFVDSVVVRDGSLYSTFTPIDKKLIDLSDGEETIMHTFRARYNQVTQEYLFLQSGAVCGSRGYIITVGLDVDTQDADLAQYQGLIESFGCERELTNEDEDG